MLQTEDLEKVHATGFDLQDVKIAFNHDIKVNVAGIEIDAKEGEIMNLPRYVATVLEDEKHGQIQEMDMVVELKQAIVKENVQGASSRRFGQHSDKSRFCPCVER